MTMNLKSNLFAALLIGLTASHVAAQSATNIAIPLDDGPHQRLLHYVDEAGKEQPVRTADDWQRRRAQIVAGFEQVAGPLPAEMRRGTPDAPTPAPLDLKILETTEQAGVPRQTISFAARNGERVTAYLWVPKEIPAGERRAAVVALQPTGVPGKAIVAGDGPLANRAYGLELAQRGYVVIAPDYVSFGDQIGHDFEKDDYQSGTIKGIVDHIRCVDYLQSRDDVDPARIGVIGHSLGGHNALFLALFDPRIGAIISSCGWTPFHHYYEGKKLQNWAQQRYMPAVTEKFNNDPSGMPFDFYELVAALAPRPFLSVSPLHDANFDYRGVKKAAAKARAVYELLANPDLLQARYPDCKHDFPNPQRREAYAFFDAHLKHKPTSLVPAPEFGTRTLVQIKSTVDGTEQPSYVIVPSSYAAATAPVPLLVSLHSWSGNLNQQPWELMEGANARGWIMISPNFRGPNDTPAACGSKFAQQDVLDAVEWACREYKIDRKRIYLTGSSGGGHMTMQMVGNHPQVWAAASAWVGISDLVAWHRIHAMSKYGAMMRAACGGAPGDSTLENRAAVDAEYAFRSPKTHLHRATGVPFEIAAGIFDGHFGHSVPVRHSLEAFNEVAKANGEAPIDEATIEAWSAAPWRTHVPTVDGEQLDPTYDRTIYFRRTSKNARVTLFEGDHERLDAAAILFLEQHTKP